ncbi:MAG: ABC transporter ATP-binding protein [Geminicoccaceae bacterium]
MNGIGVCARHGSPVSFEGVTKHYGDFVALQPTDLAIEPGEFFAVIGPSGSGKTTLLGITAGFVTPSEGAVRVAGSDTVAIPPYRRNIGMVFQNYSLFPHMTVAENIGFPLRMRKVAKADIRERVEAALRMVRLEGYGERRPSQLSGGQQQRVALARAAVYEPGLLLMDEPLGALDKNLREEMQDEIKRLQTNLGATVIYVTHDQQEAASMADRVAIMRSGRVEQVGSPRELYERPNSHFVATFLGEATLLPIATVLARDADTVTVRTDAGLEIRLAGSGASGTGASLCLRPESIALSTEPPELENGFPGVVDAATYTAGSLRYRVVLQPSGTSLLVRAPTRLGVPPLQVGQRVWAGWARSDAILVEET